MYQLESTVYNQKNWKVETLPMPLKKADRLIKDRLERNNGSRRYRLVKV